MRETYEPIHGHVEGEREPGHRADRDALEPSLLDEAHMLTADAGEIRELLLRPAETSPLCRHPARDPITIFVADRHA